METNKKNTPYDPSIYSAYAYSNAKSTVDKTRLSYSFWNGSLKISISPKTPESSEDNPSFDYKNGITIFLSHTKARLLSYVLKEFMKDPEANDNTGVAAGSCIITFSTGVSFGAKNPLIIIRKVDGEGNIESSFAYEVKRDYYSSVKGFSESNKEYTSVLYPNIEFEQMLTVLEEFYKAQTNAIAYSVMDSNKWNDFRINNKINEIGKKLGVNMSSSGSSGSYSNNSFFNKNNSNTVSANDSTDSGMDAYLSATLDDID